MFGLILFLGAETVITINDVVVVHPYHDFKPDFENKDLNCLGVRLQAFL